MNKITRWSLILTSFVLFPSILPGQWKPNVVRELNGTRPPVKLHAKLQIVTKDWNNVVYVPYLVYMPEKKRLLMLVNYGEPSEATVITSDDWGATWSHRKFVHVDATGKPDTGLGVSLTYLGGGKLVLVAGEGKALWFSSDYGETWGNPTPMPPAGKNMPFYMWDPMLAEHDPTTGRLLRLFAVGYHPVTERAKAGEPAWTHSQGQIRFSTDGGRTWSKGVNVPQWRGVNEIALGRAKNGDLVAACRTDPPKRFRKMDFDHYCGLGASVSKDNGRTWSKVDRLYEWGRHHPSMVTLPNGDIVMTYVVRLGYPPTPECYPQWGIEAVVSHDNGQTWDLDHRYILVSWHGKQRGMAAWVAGSQQTSTVLLPDGSLLTAFGTGYRALAVNTPRWRTAMDVGLVSWRVNPHRLRPLETFANAPYNSKLRNEFDLNALNGEVADHLPCLGRNVAVPAMGARVTASSSDVNPNLLLYDAYVQPVVTLKTIPAWVEVKWHKKYRINEIRIDPGAPCIPRWPQGLDTESTPVDYRLQYLKNGKWVDIIPPVTNAETYSEFRKTAKWNAEFQYDHKFAPISAKAIRLYITRSGDPGTRKKSGGKVVVPEKDRQTVLRRIEVLAVK